MTDKIKLFLSGLLIGAIIAFPLGINFGKDAPLLSNPFEKRDIKTKVKDKAKVMLEEAKESIHEATKPVEKK
jgi:gas vesicle protein